MEKNKLGKTELFVTSIGFGVLTVGKTQLNLSIEDGAKIIRYGLERGINFLDTAQYYETYPYIREALKDKKFKPVICSKSLDATYEQMKFAVQEAREEMDLEVIDIFLLHEVRQDPDWNDRAGAWKYLIEAKESGLVKAIGISTHHVDVVEKMIDIPEVDVIFPLINMNSLGIRKADGPGTKEEMADAIEKSADAVKGVFAMKVFGGGNLTSQYLEALDYVQGLPGISSLMIGFGHKDEIDRIAEYVDGTLPPEYTPDISRKKIQIDRGDCEGCGACLNRCPNKAIKLDADRIAVIDRDICLNCGYCAPKCPVRAIIFF